MVKKHTDMVYLRDDRIYISLTLFEYDITDYLDILIAKLESMKSR
ncbi:hypothetical protein TZ86_00771 [Streptococcus gordonii]|uniref:Uncharacterized protein n=1 Tax=Streptococcus gordonii TaxID=1302 RepID=A0AAW3H740_STRGN|nr:hypothetical protein TZ86_00771 [Streptococcus gordonii]